MASLGKTILNEYKSHSIKLGWQAVKITKAFLKKRGIKKSICLTYSFENAETLEMEYIYESANKNESKAGEREIVKIMRAIFIAELTDTKQFLQKALCVRVISNENGLYIVDYRA